ncbi:hypothetical protein [Paraburkholderia acidiphila]|uniref:Uncharacterized protein n=1 Tax=Paraburkholderia acidiphila TaxID=2571747 RepID=A0A7Z2JAQ3_9BURK|nr:hypothetical protein [Paraburkholderia acidiphila]QGZ56694.1 hypothetical protein FAZ97_17155 [Paraburkholderia acidiphila]
MAGFSSGSARDLPVAGQGQDSTRIAPRVGRHVFPLQSTDYPATESEYRPAILIITFSAMRHSAARINLK